jgi:hypothetical protein
MVLGIVIIFLNALPSCIEHISVSAIFYLTTEAQSTVTVTCGIYVKTSETREG